MSKRLAMWCVFDPKGGMLPFTPSMRRKDSILTLRIAHDFRIGWDAFRAKGYTCRKVRVTIEEVKP